MNFLLNRKSCVFINFTFLEKMICSERPFLLIFTKSNKT